MLNKIQVIGRVGKDPETRHLQNGNSVSNFSVAASESWKDRDGNKCESTEWFDCEVWGNLSKVVEDYVSKGDLLYLEGKQKTHIWENENGESRQRKTLEVKAFKMLGIKGNKEPKPSSQAEEVEVIDEGYDLPF